MAERTWSQQQNAIFDWFAGTEATGDIFPSGAQMLADLGGPSVQKHLIVRARAGTGKTTTIIEGINRAPEQNILLCAFNKRIAEELVARLSNPHATAKTLHAVGYTAVRRYWENIRIGNGTERADALTEAICGTRCPDALKRIVSKLHTLGREINPHATKPDDLRNIAYDFDCVPDDIWAADGFDVDFVVHKALAAMALAANKKPLCIDFADMIFLPVRNHWLTKTYDLVVVDEAQDMTVAQLEIAKGVCRGRICVVGDDRQAIYGFRGADSGSLGRLKTELGATELKLTTTYRCGRAIVERAAQLVPDFEAGPENPEGVVGGLAYDKLLETVTQGDFVLSRTNAPLVSVAMQLLRNGKRARIAGRDIGAGLKSLVRKFKARSIPDLLSKIRAWESREVTRALKAGREAKVDAVNDQAETLISLTEGAKSVADLEARIDALFTDDGLGQAGIVTCSSVHRAKGLEANRVFVLAWTLRNHNQEEQNIEYVAVTRAKTELVMVTEVKS